MSTVSGLSSALSYSAYPNQSVSPMRVTVSHFEGTYTTLTGDLPMGPTDSTSLSPSASDSYSSAPVTLTQVYAPTVTSADGQTSTPVTVTEVDSPSVSPSQNQSDLLQALIAAQSRADQVNGAGDGGGNTLSESIDTQVPADDPYAANALSTYSSNSSDYLSPASAQAVSAWA